jgi:uncharacterized protein (TIGR03067 family)
VGADFNGAARAPHVPEVLQRLAMHLTVQGNNYTLHRGTRSYPMTLHINPAVRLKTIDLTLNYGHLKGKTVLGIYELNGDSLRVCQAPAGRKRPTSFSTMVTPPVFVYVFQREKR